jgi:AcrR family transcriptional regulator
VIAISAFSARPFRCEDALVGGTTHAGSTDGRSMRRTKNRDAVLDAVIEIFEEGDLDPPVDVVAERAGVSNRSIYRYFDHRDHLMRAAVTRSMRRVIPEIQLTDVGIGGFEERVDRFVDHRLQMYQRLAPITRAAKRAAQSEPIIREEFEAGRLVLRRSFLDHFAEEFAALGPAERTRAVLAAELAFQFDAFEFLWTSTNGQVAEMRVILVDHLVVHLGRLRSAPAS